MTKFDQAFYEINDAISRVENKFLTHDQAQMVRDVVSQALDDFGELEKLKLEALDKFNSEVDRVAEEYRLLNEVQPDVTGDLI